MKGLGLEAQRKGGVGPKHRWQDYTGTGARNLIPNWRKKGRLVINGDEFLRMALDVR